MAAARSAWLCLLAPFFFASYGAANWLAAQRADVGSVVFDWEHAIPFLPWTIVPYWSIDLFYGLSLFVCANRAELDTHARRLLTAQIVAVVCFILFPLRFTFARPEATGSRGFLFAALTSFDKPFNQAPSLHIALLVILWVLYARHVPRWALWLLHAWFALLVALGADDLPAPFHRPADRRAARLLLPVAVAGRSGEPARRRRGSPAIRSAAAWPLRYAAGAAAVRRAGFRSAGPRCGCCGRRSRWRWSPRITPHSGRAASRRRRTAE